MSEMSSTTKSGIQTSADGTSYIPSSKRSDGSTRKEIRVRPGYRPPEDVETYKNRSAEAWKTRGNGGVPGAETSQSSTSVEETKSKNAKRREAAKRKKELETPSDEAENGVTHAIDRLNVSEQGRSVEVDAEPGKLVMNSDVIAEVDAERQKKIRNQLKRLRAVRELKEKKTNGEKLSHDQLMKIGKEDELLRDLRKLDYDGPELAESSNMSSSVNSGS